LPAEPIAMKWLLLIYKIPREPTAGRVYIWRKLKQLGAVSMQDAVWILPASPRTQEQFQWLATEIVEYGGEVSIFVSDLSYAHDDAALREAFAGPVRVEYESILTALKRRKPNLPELAKRYVDVKARDYFSCKLGERVRARLLKAQEGKKS
jgi:hypothetical protein